jgi:NADH-quinone oxidoreductase subunit A
MIENAVQIRWRPRDPSISLAGPGRISPGAASSKRPFTRAKCYIVAMPSGYIPILIFLAVAVMFPIVALILAQVLRPSAPFVTKLEAYECGIKAASDSRSRYTVRFYIIAILFVIFDVETVFLYPWAVRYKFFGWFGVAEVAVFLAILVVGYIWAYKKGALEWV